jgi:hypothetical protein
MALVILLTALPLAIISCRRDAQTEPPSLSGQVWGASLAGTPLVLYVMRETRSRSVSASGEDGDRYEPYSRFALIMRRIPDGALLHALPLGDRTFTGDRNGPQIIGVVGDVVWIWRDSLEARSLSDLTLRATVATLTRGAVESPAELPNEASGFAVLPDTSALVARGRDARFYRIDVSRSIIEPLDPGTLPPTTFSMRTEDRFDHLVPPWRARAVTHPYNAMQKSFLTSTGQWYALLSESERSQQSKWPRGEDHPSGDVARSLHRAPYRVDDRNVPEIDPASLTPIGNERLIQAGFLVRRERAVWDVADPSSTLVLTRRLLGAAEPWDVVRLTRDGTVLWRTSTELPEPSAILDLGSHIGFLGPESTPTAGDRGGRRRRLVWIDQRTGERGSVFLGGEGAESPVSARDRPRLNAAGGGASSDGGQHLDEVFLHPFGPFILDQGSRPHADGALPLRPTGDDT